MKFFGEPNDVIADGFTASLGKQLIQMCSRHNLGMKELLCSASRSAIRAA